MTLYTCSDRLDQVDHWRLVNPQAEISLSRDPCKESYVVAELCDLKAKDCVNSWKTDCTKRSWKNPTSSEWLSKRVWRRYDESVVIYYHRWAAGHDRTAFSGRSDLRAATSSTRKRSLQMIGFSCIICIYFASIPPLLCIMPVQARGYETMFFWHENDATDFDELKALITLSSDFLIVSLRERYNCWKSWGWLCTGFVCVCVCARVCVSVCSSVCV